MAAPRSGGGGPGLLLRAIGRLGLLVALGFAAGLVIGVAIEEPRLLFGHLRGESESVRLVDAPYADRAGTDEAGREDGHGDRIADAGGTTDATREARDASGAGDPGDAAERAQARDTQAERLVLRDQERRQARENPMVSVAAGRADSDRDVRASARADVSAASPDAAPPSDASRWAIQVGAFGDERVAIGLVDRLTAKRYPVDLIPSTDHQHRWRVRIQPIRGKARAQEIANRLKQEDGLPTWLILLEADAG